MKASGVRESAIILLTVLGVFQFLCPVAVLAGDGAEVGQTSGAVISVTNDTHVGRQWALQRIRGLIVEPTEAKEVLVAVLDTGIDDQHEDLAGKVVGSVNLTDSDAVCDRFGHGTHVAGIIAAEVNNGKGIAGAAPNARLLNVKVADDDGHVKASVAARGIIWAVDNGARVINMSLVIPASTPALKEAVDYAWSRGVVIVAAAGNTGSQMPTYPASFPDVVAVGATGMSGDLWEKSNRGDWVDVYAPGTEIFSALPGNGYGYKSGTSMATAYVSAIAARIYSVVTDADGDGLVNDEVAEMLKWVFAMPR